MDKNLPQKITRCLRLATMPGKLLTPCTFRANVQLQKVKRPTSNAGRVPKKTPRAATSKRRIPKVKRPPSKVKPISKAKRPTSKTGQGGLVEKARIKPGMRFAHTKTWDIDVIDKDPFYTLYHVFSVAGKSIKVFSRSYFGKKEDLCKEGHELLDEQVSAYENDTSILNVDTEPYQRYLKEDEDHDIYFINRPGEKAVRFTGEVINVTRL